MSVVYSVHTWVHIIKKVFLSDHLKVLMASLKLDMSLVKGRRLFGFIVQHRLQLRLCKCDKDTKEVYEESTKHNLR